MLEEQRREEVAQAEKARRREMPALALKQTRTVQHDPICFIRSLASGHTVRVPAASSFAPIVRLFRRIEQASNRAGDPLRPNLEALQRLLMICQERTCLFCSTDADAYADAVLALTAHLDRWIREPEDWFPQSHNAYKQFQHFVRHLLAYYDVPTFLDSAWLQGMTKHGLIQQGWFIHTAQGHNIRTATGLPILLTKKQAHLFLQAPDDFDPLSALRWAQVRSLGGDECLIRSILGTRAGVDFERDDFWITVFRWLVNQPMRAPSQDGPIIDYLRNQRIEPTERNPLGDLPGQPRLVPAQPNLTMKGRNPEALLHAVEQWHHRLNNVRGQPETRWAPSKLDSFLLEEGKDEDWRLYSITELLTSTELQAEGKAMRHCVASYWQSCYRGDVSIWSLKSMNDVGSEERLLNLEVENSTRTIIQSRGKCNGLPNKKQKSLIRRWATSAALRLSRWL